VLWHPVSVKAVAAVPGHRWCLSGATDGRARLWDLDRPSRPMRTFGAGEHKGSITCVAVSPDGKYAATGGSDRAVCLWNLDTGDLLYRLCDAHRGALTNLHFTPASP